MVFILQKEKKKRKRKGGGRKHTHTHPTETKRMTQGLQNNGVYCLWDRRAKNGPRSRQNSKHRRKRGWALRALSTFTLCVLTSVFPSCPSRTVTTVLCAWHQSTSWWHLDFGLFSEFAQICKKLEFKSLHNISTHSGLAKLSKRQWEVVFHGSVINAREIDACNM